jgi:hypothetical protein
METAALLEKARAYLSTTQFAGLVLWLKGADDADIMLELRLAEEAGAARLVRSALKRIRD